MMPASTTASFNDIKNNNNNKKINDVQWNCGKKSAQPTSNSVNRKQKSKSDAEGPKKKEFFLLTRWKTDEKKKTYHVRSYRPAGSARIESIYTHEHAIRRLRPTGFWRKKVKWGKEKENWRQWLQFYEIKQLRDSTMKTAIIPSSLRRIIIRPPNTVAAGWRRRRSYLRWDLTSIETRWWAWRRHKRSLSLSDALRGCRVLRWLRHEYNRRAH